MLQLGELLYIQSWFLWLQIMQFYSWIASPKCKGIYNPSLFNSKPVGASMDLICHLNVQLSKCYVYSSKKAEPTIFYPSFLLHQHFYFIVWSRSGFAKSAKIQKRLLYRFYNGFCRIFTMFACYWFTDRQSTRFCLDQGLYTISTEQNIAHTFTVMDCEPMNL